MVVEARSLVTSHIEILERIPREYRPRVMFISQSVSSCGAKEPNGRYCASLGRRGLARDFWSSASREPFLSNAGHIRPTVTKSRSSGRPFDVSLQGTGCVTGRNDLLELSRTLFYTLEYRTGSRFKNGE